MLTLACLLLLAMGALLSTLGTGGSLLTLPILELTLGMSPGLASTYSLLLVGLVGLVALFRWPVPLQMHFILKLGAFSALGTATSRTFFLPHINQHYTWVLDGLLLLCLLVAAYNLIWPLQFAKREQTLSFGATAASVTGIGLFFGLIGIGGGFILSPFLHSFCRIPMKEAIGSGLCIIAINCAVGFGTSHSVWHELNPLYMALFIGSSLGGMWVGTSFVHQVSEDLLKKALAVCLVLVACMIALK